MSAVLGPLARIECRPRCRVRSLARRARRRTCAPRIVNCTGGEASVAEWSQFAEGPLEDVLAQWRGLYGSQIDVRLMQPTDVRAAGKTISEVFYETGSGMLDGLFGRVFEGDVVAGIQTSLRYRSKSQFALLVVWDAVGDRVLGAVQVSVETESRVLQYLPTDVSSYAYVSSMAVLPEARRRGIGSALLAAAELVAWRWGETEIALHVHKHNNAARDLYLQRGYEEISSSISGVAFFKGPETVLLRRRR